VTGNVVVTQHPSVRMPNSSVKMSRTVWWFKLNSLPITVTVKCRSHLTTALTLVILPSVFYVQCLPERGSFSTNSKPSKILYAASKPVPSIQHALHFPILICRKFMLCIH
jgi:hypothetical protein